MEFKSVMSLFVFFCLLGRLDCTDPKNLTVKQGADATLECSGPADATLIMIRWEKPDLQSDDCVICFRDGQRQKEIQHELFKDRVEMKNPKWNETGDFSVILKNVTTNDNGTYTCEAGYDGQKPQLLSRVTLKVEVPGQTGQSGGKNDGEKNGGRNSGSVGLIIGLSVSALLLVAAAVGFVIYRKCGNSNYGSPSEQGQEVSA